MKRILSVIALMLSFNVLAHQEVSINCDIPHDDYPTFVTKITFHTPSLVTGFVGFTHRSGISGYLPYPRNSLNVVNTEAHRVVKTNLQLFGFTMTAINFPHEIFESVGYTDVEFVTNKGSMTGTCSVQ
jgi:hypothetical protein